MLVLSPQTSVWVSTLFVGPPPNVPSLAWGGLAMWLTALCAWWADTGIGRPGDLFSCFLSSCLSRCEPAFQFLPLSSRPRLVACFRLSCPHTLLIRSTA